MTSIEIQIQTLQKIRKSGYELNNKQKMLLTMDQLPFLPFLDDDLKKGDGIGRGQKAQKDKSSHVFVL